MGSKALSSIPIVGGALSSLFNAPKISMPTSTASLTDPSVANRANEVAQLAAKARGRSSTMLTGSLGISEAPSVARSVLLGG